MRSVRPTLDLRRQSTDCSVRVAYQYSDDGETWDTAEEFGPAATTTEGETVGSFTDVTSPASGNRRILIRFGVNWMSVAMGPLLVAQALPPCRVAP